MFNKKILILHNRYIRKGGEDAVVENEYQLLKRHGVSVELLLFDNNDFFNKRRFASPFQLYKNKITLKIIAEKVQLFKPNVVHIHNLFYAITPSVINFLKSKRIEIVMTVHNYRLICPSATLFYKGSIYEKNVNAFFPYDGILKGVFQQSILKTLLLSLVIWGHRYSGTWKKVDKYIFLTSFAKSKMTISSLDISNSRFFIKSNFLRKLGQSTTCRDKVEEQFIFVGRLSEEKGIHVLLDAFRTLDYKLIIYGEGPLQHHVSKIAEKNSNITYKGFCPFQIIKKDLIKSKALIFPSIWFEGMPMTIIEAFSLGLPVIASNLGGMAEMIDNHKTGFLFTSNSTKSLINSIKKSLDLTEESYKNMSENILTNFDEKYSENTAVNKLLEIYST